MAPSLFADVCKFRVDTQTGLRHKNPRGTYRLASCPQRRGVEGSDMTQVAIPTNRDKFKHELSILHGAAVGLTFIRTKEPFRALDVVREWAYGNRLPFRAWSMLTGWNEHDVSDPNVKPKVDPDMDILSAMKKIDGIGTTGTGFPVGCFAVLWPHFALQRFPQLIQIFAQYVRSSSETSKRIALIVPIGFELPPELQDSVALLDFDLPNREELREGYDRVVHGIGDPAKRPNYTEAEIGSILNGVTGMSEMEAEGAIARAAAEAGGRVPLSKFVSSVLKVKTDAVKRSEVLEVMPAVSMSKVGGLANLKRWVADRRNAFTPAAREAGVDMPKGVLLVGPPGTGKSLGAKAIASELNQSLIRFDISRVYGSLIGQSESKVRDALKTIAAMAPCVVLVDEVDKAFGRSNSDSNGGVSTRVLGAILTFMQEDTSGVFWVLTANRTNSLPTEIVRKGRLDEIWSVGLPTESERREILSIHLRQRKVDPDTISDLTAAVDETKGFVGAEIEAAVAAAKLHAFNTGVPMTGALIADQTGHTKPISEAFKEDFDAMQTWAENNARPASADVPASVARTRSRVTPSTDPGVPIAARPRARVMPSTNLDG